MATLTSVSTSTVLDPSTTSFATIATSALAVVTASLSANGTGDSNSTSPLILPMPDNGDISEGSYVLNTIIGLLIVLIASLLNAFGLNLTKLDHVRQQTIPKRERRKEYLRVLWLSGMGMYIASQLFGSTLALRWLRPDWVAPLGSSSLIFNFLFASWLVGTPVTPTDIRGTAVIVLGVILILIFSSINHGLQQSLSITRLNSFWTRGSWLAYFVFLILFTGTTFVVSHLLKRLLASRASFSPLSSPMIDFASSRPKQPHPIVAFFRRIAAASRRSEGLALRRMEKLFARTDDARLTWLQGIGWAVAGGSLAGLCLVFTKAVVKLMGHAGHPLIHPSAILTLLLVALTAILQIVCLNRALVCADTVVVVPLFYAGYTVFGFINSLIFYDEAGQYARWVLVAVFLSIAVLISGVVLLSLKSSAKAATDPYTVTTQPAGSVRLRPRAHNFAAEGEDVEAGPSNQHRERQSGEGGDAPDGGREDVLWEVGSLSDKSELEEVKLDGEEKRLGVGGGDMRGERRGLLVADDAEAEDDEEDGGKERATGAGTATLGPDVPEEAERNPFADEEGFGEYKSVGASPRLGV